MEVKKEVVDAVQLQTRQDQRERKLVVEFFSKLRGRMVDRRRKTFLSWLMWAPSGDMENYNRNLESHPPSQLKIDCPPPLEPSTEPIENCPPTLEQHE
jgi:hypothetical protein